MTAQLDQCVSHTNGARFYRGDLHIHSFQASHDVRDSNMTPQNIVATASKEGLGIIAVADHNEISNVQAAVAAGETVGVLVIPAVELSTPEGHLLCYFPTVTALAQFHGRLDLADRGQANSRCKTSMHACLDLSKELDGFCVLAHIDGGNGFETNNPGGSPHKADILCHAALLGIELSTATSLVSYGPDDLEAVRVQLGKQRIKKLGLGERQHLARILSSDSHTLTALGRNASQDRKLTRYKMTTPSFGSLRLALQEGDSRIRLEDDVPASTPRILGASFVGGYLKDQVIHFSSNLNCIIGGRGTGKSTTFEAVRCLSGDDSGAEVVDSPVWPQQLYLFWQDEAGQKHTLSRPISSRLTNVEDLLDGPIEFEIDCFGQGEAARVREQAKNDPLALLRYLDTFTKVDGLLEQEQDLRRALQSLYAQILQADQQIQTIPQTERSLNVIRQQLKAFETHKGAEVIALQRDLTKERARKEAITEQLRELKTLVQDRTILDSSNALQSSASGADIVIGKDAAALIISAVAAFDSATKHALDAISSAWTSLQASVNQAMRDWKVKEAEVQAEIEAKQSALEKAGVKLDMAHVTDLAREASKHEKSLKSLKAAEVQLKSLKSEYSTLLRKRWETREKIAMARSGYAIKASRALAEVLSDLNVKLQYTESGFSAEAVDVIVDAMNWRTINHAKAHAIVEQLTVPKLLKAMRDFDSKPLTGLKVGATGIQITPAEAKDILQKLSAPTIHPRLEQCHIDDFPRLSISRQIQDDGKQRNVQRDFSQLSLGQQQSVLLALILSSDSKRPLIIDQPEDNLDSEFIFHTFVPVLRRAKERRQVIIVTHNANIAVLGDAEQLIVFKSTNEYSRIVARGSIDDEVARDAACKILEGAREAFTRRAKIYGIK